MNQSQIYLPKLTPVNKGLIVVAAIIFIVDFILSKTGARIGLIPLLGLSAARVGMGHVYTLLTYPFLSNSLIEVILNGLMLWLMGSEFEASWGLKRYVSFLVAAILGGALLYLAVVFLFFQDSVVYSFPFTGLGGVIGALCLAYGVIYPERIFSFLMIIPIKAKYFCILLVVISLYQGIASPVGVGAWGHLGAIISAYAFMVAISRHNWTFLSGKLNKITQRDSAKKSKAKLSIVKDDNDNPPKYWQ